MKKVLIVTYSFPPKGGGGVLRQLKFAKYLPNFGWQPFILTVNKRYDFEDPQLLEELPTSCRIFRTGKNKNYKKVKNHTKEIKKENILLPFLRIISKQFTAPDRFIFWAFQAVPIGLKLIRENKIDVIYSIDNPFTNHIVGMLLHWITKKPWIVDFKDSWTGGFGYKKPLPFFWLDLFLEKKVLRNADYVICVNQSYKDRFTRYLKNKKNPPIEIITNGFDEEDFRETPELSNKPDRLCISYTGTFYHDMFPLALFKSIESLLDEGRVKNTDIKVIFAGESDNKFDLESDLMKRLTRMGIFDNLGKVTHKESIEIVRRSDVVLLTNFNIIDSETTIPLKTFEYLAARKFILALTDPDNLLSKFIDDNNAGCSVQFNNFLAIKEAVYNLFIDFKKGIFNSGATMQSKDIQKFTRRNLTLRLSEILNNISERKKVY